MQKNNNFFIAIALIVGFIFFWDAFVMRRYGPPARPATTEVSTTTATSGSAVRPPAVTDAEIADAVATPASPTGSESIVPLTAAGTEAVFLTGGARVGSWHVKEGDAWLELVMPEKHRNFAPLQTFPELNYSVRRESASEATFTARHPAGFTVTKTVSLLAEPPFHAVSLALTNTTQNEIPVQVPLAWGNGLDKHKVGTPYDKDSAASEASGVGLAQKVRRWKPGFVFSRTIDRIEEGPFAWAGVDNFHFLAALVAPEGSSIPKVQVVGNRDFPPVVGPLIDVRLKPGETVRRDYLLYVGPKSTALLKEAGHGLSEAIDYGMFGFLSKALLRVLTFYKGLTGNYGWAIILLTLTIQILIFPLTRKSLEHSVKMRELQPHLKKLQEQHKQDPKRYQIEMMNFYKKNGMKFMGLEGCLPVLLQMPIFFAFYSALNSAYELRGAEWIFWITNLAVKDPYYVLPIIMGAGMYLQQKMSAVSMDPAQARMMTLMPIMFTFMFLSMPAGLVLYWCVNSLVTIVIQKTLETMRHRQHAVPGR